jgi:hypothetical protein
MAIPFNPNYNNLGNPGVTTQRSWNDLAVRAWGGEWNAPDHNSYQFSNGRGFDSTDTGSTGIYNPNLQT